jgi:hypothetical protein
MLAEKVFFSFASITDPQSHREYNAWHQLDHRPENLALDGVIHGERWVRSPDCAAVSAVDDASLATTHYVNIYWFATPSEQSIAEWQDLAERSFQWGRRPDVAFTTRPLMGFFNTVKGYVSPRVLLSPDALPFRPTRGVHVSLTRLRAPHDPEAEALFSWYDRVRIPELLECRGAAGVWTFSSDSTTLDAEFAVDKESTTFRSTPSAPGSFRLLVVFLDEDPIEFVTDLAERDRRRGSPPLEARAVEETLFASPLRTIVPWEWGWFDER